MRHPIPSALLLGAGLLFACDDKADDDELTRDQYPPKTDTTSTSGGSGSSGGSGGTSGGSGGTTGGSSGSTSGGSTGGISLGLDDLYGVPNIDDDNENGRADWGEGNGPGLGSENDLITLALPVAELEEGQSITVTLTDVSANTIRVWEGTSEVLAFNGDSMTVTSGSGEFEIEFSDTLVSGALEIAILDTDGSELDSQTVNLLGAPVILNHHLQEGEYIWSLASSSRGWDNEQMLDTFTSVLGNSGFGELNYNAYQGDPWVQDEVEFGTMTASDGHRVDVVLDLIRDRQLDAWPENELEGPDFVKMVWGSGYGTSQDYGGNIEIAPPVTVGGVDYPFGRIYWGESGRNLDPNEDIQAFFQDMRLQDPFILDIGFLCVGHVDEFFTFVPDPAAPKGFWMVYSDTNEGFASLEGLRGTALPRYRQVHGYTTVDEILSDDALRMENEEYQEDYLDPNLAILKAELGLTDNDIIYIPAIFEEAQGCGGTSAALIPGTANLQLFMEADGTSHLFPPDPFFRAETASESSDPMIAEFESLLPSSSEIHWIDDFETYHWYLGEVHCGTNAIRTPADDWWTEAAHLLE